MLSAGEGVTRGLYDDGSITCWGENISGLENPPGGEFEAISAVASHGCGLRSAGAVECWGHNDDGQSTPPADYTWK